jgi:hypothetical protein
MAKKKFNFLNGDLIRDLEKIKSYDSPQIKKDEMENDGENIYVMDVNDSAYFYVNKTDRNSDVKTLKEYLA